MHELVEEAKAARAAALAANTGVAMLYPDESEWLNAVARLWIFVWDKVSFRFPVTGHRRAVNIGAAMLYLDESAGY